MTKQTSHMKHRRTHKDELQLINRLGMISRKASVGQSFWHLLNQFYLPLILTQLQITHMSQRVTKWTKWHMRPTKLRSAWASAQPDQSSLSAWRKPGSLATCWAHSIDSDLTHSIDSDQNDNIYLLIYTIILHFIKWQDFKFWKLVPCAIINMTTYG